MTSEQILNTAEFIYAQLISNSEGPQEAASILSAVMVKLWLTSSQPDADIDSMLTFFAKNVKDNVALNSETSH
jgi:hypothetical protein